MSVLSAIEVPEDFEALSEEIAVIWSDLLENVEGILKKCLFKINTNKINTL